MNFELYWKLFKKFFAFSRKEHLSVRENLPLPNETVSKENAPKNERILSIFVQKFDYFPSTEVESETGT